MQTSFSGRYQVQHTCFFLTIYDIPKVDLLLHSLCVITVYCDKRGLGKHLTVEIDG